MFSNKIHFLNTKHTNHLYNLLKQNLELNSLSYDEKDIYQLLLNNKFNIIGLSRIRIIESNLDNINNINDLYNIFKYSNININNYDLIIWLNGKYIDLNYRSNGFGTKLLEYQLNLIENLYLNKRLLICSDVRESNYLNYERYGFKKYQCDIKNHFSIIKEC